MLELPGYTSSRLKTTQHYRLAMHAPEHAVYLSTEKDSYDILDAQQSDMK